MRSWQPNHTHLLLVSVLEYADGLKFPAWQKTGRIDEKIHAFFIAEGVPDTHCQWLQDAGATQANVLAATRHLRESVKPGGVLFCYFTGHAYKTRQGSGCMALHDTVPNRGPHLEMREWVREIGHSLPQTNILLVADTCYAGEFAAGAKDADLQNVAVFASTTRNGNSTDNWTFSRCFYHGLAGHRGSPPGLLYPEDFAYCLKLDMAFAEKQMTSEYIPNSLARFLISETPTDDPGAWVSFELKEAGGWAPCVSVALHSDGRHTVRKLQSGEIVENVSKDMLRKPEFRKYAVGAEVKLVRLPHNSILTAKIIGEFQGLAHIEWLIDGHREWVFIPD